MSKLNLISNPLPIASIRFQFAFDLQIHRSGIFALWLFRFSIIDFLHWLLERGACRVTDAFGHFDAAAALNCWRWWCLQVTHRTEGQLREWWCLPNDVDIFEPGNRNINSRPISGYSVGVLNAHQSNSFCTNQMNRHAECSCDCPFVWFAYRNYSRSQTIAIPSA